MSRQIFKRHDFQTKASLLKYSMAGETITLESGIPNLPKTTAFKLRQVSRLSSGVDGVVRERFDIDNFVVGVINGSKVTFALSRDDLVPNADRGSPHTHDDSIEFFEDEYWRIVYQIIPMNIQEFNIGNFELRFINDGPSDPFGSSVGLSDKSQAMVNFLTELVDNCGFTIPRKHRVYFVNHVDYDRNKLWEREVRDTHSSSTEIEFLNSMVSYTLGADSRLSIQKLDANADNQGNNLLAKIIYSGDEHGRQDSDTDVGVVFISNMGFATIMHEFFHAINCDFSNRTVSSFGSLNPLNDRWKSGNAFEAYKILCGNNDLIEIPTDASKKHTSPVGFLSVVARPPAFVMINGIPHPLPHGVLSYTIGVASVFLELIVASMQGAEITNHWDFAPKQADYFKTMLCLNAFHEYYDTMNTVSRSEPVQLETTGIKSALQSVSGTKSWFLVRLAHWGFFPGVSTMNNNRKIVSVEALYSAFEEFYEDEYDLPYSDIDSNGGNVILFKADSQNPSLSDSSINSPSDNMNFFAHNSNSVLNYAGFRVVDNIMTIENGEILFKITQNLDRIPDNKSNFEPRLEKLIVSEKPCVEYDAEYGTTMDNVIKSYFGGRKHAHKIEVPNADPSLPFSCKEYYIIIDDTPSKSFSSYTIQDRFESLDDPILII